MLPESWASLRVFIAFSALFAIAFIWFVTETALLALQPVWRLPHPAFAAAGVGVLMYATIGLAVWFANPDTINQSGGAFRAITSVAWMAGVLLELGSFSDYSCGI